MRTIVAAPVHVLPGWLRLHLADIDQRTFPLADGGRLRLVPPGAVNMLLAAVDAGLAVDGDLLGPGRRRQRVFGALRVHWAALGPARTEVRVEARPELEPLVREILAALAARWPNAAEAAPAPAASPAQPPPVAAGPEQHSPSAASPAPADTTPPPEATLSTELSERDRTLLEEWRAGKSVKALARERGRRPTTIRNRLTILRKRLGTGLVPYAAAGARQTRPKGRPDRDITAMA